MYAYVCVCVCVQVRLYMCVHVCWCVHICVRTHGGKTGLYMGGRGHMVMGGASVDRRGLCVWEGLQALGRVTEK